MHLSIVEEIYHIYNIMSYQAGSFLELECTASTWYRDWHTTNRPDKKLLIITIYISFVSSKMTSKPRLVELELLLYSYEKLNCS